jgi:quinol monooxygenase YgiN
MVVNTTRVTLHPDKRREFLQTMKRLVEPIKAARGCLTFRFYIDAADENSSLLMGEWETESDLNDCLRSKDFSVLRGAITVLSVGSTEFKAEVTRSPWKA